MYAIGGESAWYQPPDPLPDCQWCDGGTKVDVSAVIDTAGEVHTVDAVEVKCPRCNGTGIDPGEG